MSDSGIGHHHRNGQPHPLDGYLQECRSIKEFGTERARDLWQRNHPHEVNA